MKVEFTTEARDDFFEAAEYYESKEKGLGSRMRDEISKIIRTVARCTVSVARTWLRIPESKLSGIPLLCCLRDSRQEHRGGRCDPR